ncbi:bifunctional phosphopantothenoylcysteine decarboxylase/phosphopantothenate--cysteine ligase CoaBC [Christensenella tenuis]|uniref:Coenzyme A biosynthesis bifunctional protein CoaBC n=1 Tax=Christensenella tenuis TaxID=2763033 RepID=A0ABR7EBL7_9FIRM|nr:bifunctional phosphopantothenoylcysteine decarboxylase/phosphopantothenate--cysteine ligase CoaBC [Christensenella tenuis]MBC5647063.1 bifunctional phosphopantothenoylcysteine decarboxylase/phosphopantothenate--cysteine ligase CoaBC [Christensenella tenuis]
MLDGKNVLLGVTGGIAAYKAANLVSMLKKEGADVDVVMTEAATRFVAPLTFETLSKNAVAIDLFSREKPWEVEHIALAQKADIAIVAPATANTIAKLACGIADNMLTTTLLACTCPIFIAPAMNTAMFENIATRVNLQILKDRGYIVLPAAEGELACGQTGAGRMLEPADILSAVEKALKKKGDFSGRKFLITAGPTREAIDPVRYLTNRSSGRMGYALAAAAVARGAEVLLISGPVALERPRGVEVYPVQSAEEMYQSVMSLKDKADIIIMCAAVADYTPVTCAEHKMKKQERLRIDLTRTKDILAELGKDKQAFLAGFAAETQNLEGYAKDKLSRKNLDMIIANDVSGPETGFDSEYNAVSIYTEKGAAVHLEKDTKRNLADRILTEIAKNI